ncbi:MULTISPECIES: HAD family hydrolase [Caldilinea]|uniref:Putative hydrolase n=1 Tax=Caldilinea aerophila (strain DSM 14535 / JCM 11387 / NBRC 104270 / STL-6-O1) TaxID=926550 RepID=I0I336_CALAS|nr:MULTISPECIES: HAD family hydrolase [Caldilinea]BAL99673.1 putative hydrolase [Caldilinea aerophila DSM 14535 = NBRC 104270]GIV73728.1 MAG: 2-haloalkanoic acid dehalogenase [Caldilinea sp.]
MIQALTFDFWDTIAVDDSDEPKRARLGLPPKSAERMQLFVDHITRRYPHITRHQAEEAYRQANARFQAEWREHHRTPGVHRRLSYAYEYLGLRPAPGRYAAFLREVNELAHAIETMEVRIAPDFAPHFHAVVVELSRHYVLGIISDTIHTNGRGIRHLLYQQGLLSYFRFFLFSDEVGVSKPSAQIFRRAALELGLPPALIAHVGDREQNDVLGPLSVGMRAILYTGIVDRGSHCTRAHAVCRDFRQLPSILQRMT